MLEGIPAGRRFESEHQQGAAVDVGKQTEIAGQGSLVISNQ
jgi:hypothetical protein